MLQHRNWGEWKTPSLRDVMRHYSELDLDRLHADGEALLRPLTRSEPEIDDLVAFLRTLSAPEPSVTRR